MSRPINPALSWSGGKGVRRLGTRLIDTVFDLHYCISFPEIYLRLNCRRLDLGTRPPRLLSPPCLSLRLLCFVDLNNMDVSPKALKRVCKRFRVLIIGRRNAGKTTILEKMTGSEVGAEPEIRDEHGVLVVCTSLSLYVTFNSQTDGYRMMQHSSRQGWRCVDRLLHLFTHSPKSSVG